MGTIICIPFDWNTGWHNPVLHRDWCPCKWRKSAVKSFIKKPPLLIKSLIKKPPCADNYNVPDTCNVPECGVSYIIFELIKGLFCTARLRKWDGKPIRDADGKRFSWRESTEGQQRAEGPEGTSARNRRTTQSIIINTTGSGSRG